MQKVEKQNETAVAGTQNNGKIGRVNFIVHRAQKVFIACPPPHNRPPVQRRMEEFQALAGSAFTPPRIPAIKVIDRLRRTGSRCVYVYVLLTPQ
jgi:hypothetical protein